MRIELDGSERIDNGGYDRHYERHDGRAIRLGVASESCVLIVLVF
ncbi:MAG: hypothetical protein WBD74_02840 [Candidatus Aquilonibacter sp.]